MPVKQTPPRVKRAATDIGTQLTAWRKLQNLTAQQVAERANIGLSTLRRVEHGDPGVTLETLLGVLRALGALDRMVDALDPYTTDLGRTRASTVLPQRIRH
jgi:transcriptional regulator with XRE-family HTH domain